MKVYWKPGSELTLLRNGPDNQAAGILTFDLATSGTFDVLCQVSASPQRSKAGVTRTMFKCEMILPAAIGSVITGNACSVGSIPTSGEPFTVHSVVTTGPVMSSLLQNYLFKTAAQALVSKGIGIVVALMSGNDSVQTDSLNFATTVFNGINGLFPLDIETGEYGDPIAPV